MKIRPFKIQVSDAELDDLIERDDGTISVLHKSRTDGIIIVNVGEAEKAQINSEERDLLKEACKLRPDLCLRAP